MLFHSPPGVLFTFPSQYCALSVTESYLALGGGPPSFPQGSTCLAVLWILLASVGFRVRGFHPLRQAFPKPFCYPSSCLMQSEPLGQVQGLGSSGFARRYFRNRCFFLFLALLRCFSSGGSPCMTMDSSCSDGGSLRRVAPFRYPRITRYLLLPVAFRSLSRLSSALSAKAFTLCPLSLDLRMLVRILPTFGVASPTHGLISSHCHHQELLLRSKLDSASLHLARIVALYGCPASLASKLAVCLFHPCNSCDSRMKLIFLSSF